MWCDGAGSFRVSEVEGENAPLERNVCVIELFFPLALFLAESNCPLELLNPSLTFS